MNSTWIEILYYFKRKSKPIIMENDIRKEKKLDISPKHVNEYLEYIKASTSIYKERVNLDKNYLKLYDELELLGNECVNSHININNYKVFESINKTD